MEDIDTCLCKVVQDLTFGNIESLKEMSNGYLLSNLLNRLDPQIFYMSKKLENWMTAKMQIEYYLNKKGLQNQILDFDEKGISEGALEHLISAILQILAIFAAFNEKDWYQLSEQFESIQKNLILPILNPMISDIMEERQQVPKKEEIKTLLLRLEDRETELGETKKRLLSKEEELDVTSKEIQKLTYENNKLTSELEDLHRLKNETIKQIEEFYANKEDRENENELSRRLNKTVAERDELSDKLFRLQLVVTDKESEIEKLTLIKNAYENKKSDIESFTEQIHYYKTQSEKLKAEVEVKDSKLNALEHADVQIIKLREKVKELTSKLSKVKLEKIEYENTVKTMEKKLEMANEKVDFIRRKSQSVMEPINDITQESGYVSKLETENDRLKQKVSYLIKELSEGDIERMDSELIEKENQLLTGRVKGLLLQCKSITSQNQTGRYKKPSQELADVVYGSLEKRCSNKSKKRDSTIQNIDSENFLTDEKTDQTENMTLLYSVCMEFLQKDLMKTRVLAPTYDERKRDIFKQFALSNVMRPTNRY